MRGVFSLVLLNCGHCFGLVKNFVAIPRKWSGGVQGTIKHHMGRPA
jgi:hypothetical protein